MTQAPKIALKPPLSDRPQSRRLALQTTALMVAGMASWPAQTIAAATAATGCYPPVKLRRLNFPRDHGAHPEYRTEWWYLTGWLGQGPTAMGFQLTFFRSRTQHAPANPSRLAPTQLLFAHAALAVAPKHVFLHANRSGRLGGTQLRAETADTDVQFEDWHLRRTQGARGEVYAGRFAGEGFAVSFDASTALPALLRGQDGFSSKGPEALQASHYYSRAPLSVKADGSALYYTRCNQPGGLGSCDLYVSDLDGRGWKRGSNLGSPVNGGAWDCQPAISGDGHTLIFSSNRPGGFGGKDLWISYLKQGKWSVPKNMGPAINTRDDDDAPFLHYDGVTLYFSSLGHPGFGGSDIFMSRMGADAQWSTPENLGSGLNTSEDEFGLYIDAGGKKGYFASDRKGGLGRLDIYQFDVPEKFKPIPVTYVSGRIEDAQGGLPLMARVRVVELSTGKVVFSDSVSNFFIPLTAGGNYALFATAKGYVPHSMNFQPTASTLDQPFSVVAKLTPINNNSVFVLRNLFFDTDKYDLKPESAEELLQLVELMKMNPKMEVMITGHTDNQGAADYNVKLSENRAASVVAYLVKAGIASARLKWKGYGDSRPAAPNDTEEGRAKNRRIELVILKAS